MKIIILAFLFSISSWAGNDVENGGDAVALEFTTTARLAIGNLNMANLSPDLKSLVDKISRSVESTRVNSLPHLFIGEDEVDAINYPLKNRILVSRSGWKIAKLVSVETRMGLVLHEYLGVSKVDDSDYSQSQKLIKAMSPDSFGNLLAQEIFLDSVHNLGGYFWNYMLNPDLNQKQVCIFAGDISGRIQNITRFTKSYPKWFHSKVTKYANDLQAVAKEIEMQCLREKVDYQQLEKSCERGNLLTYYFEDLLFSN